MSFEPSLDFVMSPAFLSLSDAAARLWLLASCYVEQHQTNITPEVLKLFGKESAARELVLRGFWIQNFGGWEVVKQETGLSQKRREAGRRGGLAKASKQPSKPLANTVANGLANSDFASVAKPGLVPPLASPSPEPESGLNTESSPDSSSFQLSSEGSEPSPARAPQKPKTERRKARHALPPEWVPNAKHLARATELRLSAAEQANKFRDHAAATGRLMASWDAAFTMWLDRAPQFDSSPVASLPARSRPINASDDERTRMRNNLLDDAKAGRAGPRAKAWAESGKDLGKLADELEAWQRKRQDRQLAQQVAPLLEGVGR